MSKEFTQRCEAVGLNEGCLFTWLEKVETLQAENAALLAVIEAKDTVIKASDDLLRDLESSGRFYGLAVMEDNEQALAISPSPELLEARDRKPVDVVPPAWTNLIEYVLQDDLHNRLTPRVVDIAYTAFMLAKQPNSEDGGNSDWFNDTKPSVMEAIAKLRKDLVEFTRPPNTADIEQRVAEAWYDGNKFYANEESASMACADMANLEPLFTLPPTAEQIEQATAEAIAKMIQGWSCTNGPSIAEAIRSGKWREYL